MMKNLHMVEKTREPQCRTVAVGFESLQLLPRILAMTVLRENGRHGSVTAATCQAEPDNFVTNNVGAEQ